MLSNVVHPVADDDEKRTTLHSRFANFATTGSCHGGVPEVTVQEMLHTLQIDFADADYGRQTADGAEDDEAEQEEDDD